MMITLANEFAERGFEVDLLVAQKEGPLLETVSDKVRVVDLRASRLLWALWPVVKYLRHTRPETLIGSMEHVVIISVLAKWLSWSRVRIISRVANTLSVSLQGTKWYRKALRKYGAFVFYRLVDRVVCNSQGSADDLARTLWLARERIRVIYNPTVTPALLEKAKEVPDHPWLNTDDQKVILGVGRLHPQKDFATLIRALAVLKHSFNTTHSPNKHSNIRKNIGISKFDLKLIILGEGEERARLEGLIKELNLEGEVDLPGFADNPYAFMAHCDVYVLSSRWEGLPNTLIEALAVGTPVVATDCPSGPGEILEGGNYGRLVPVSDPPALAEAIVKALTAPPNPEKLKARAREFAVEYSAERYLELVERRG